MPGRAIDRGKQARVHVALWPSTPFLAGRYQLELDDALRAEIHFDRAVRRLSAERNDDPETLPERGLNLGLEDDFAEVGRPDLLLALAHQDDVDRGLLAR